MPFDARKWLADALLGRPCESLAIADDDSDVVNLLVAARREGVVALIEAQWSRNPESAPSSPELRRVFAEATRQQAMWLMWARAEATRLLAALDAAGLRVLVLKGIALGDWLYPATHLRAVGDLDLLVGSEDEARRTREVLASCGYAGGYVQGAHAYERLCIPESATALRLEVDLHWRLLNAPVFAERIRFDSLWTHAIALPGLGPAARGLCPAHALAHVAMDRVVNLYTGVGDRLKALVDIHLLAAQFDSGGWAEVVQLAADSGLCGVVHAGLDAARAELGSPVPGEVRDTLTRGAARETLDPRRMGNWTYMQLQSLRSLPWRHRVAWLWARLFPDPSYLRHGEAREQSLTALRWRRLGRLLRRLLGAGPDQGSS